LRQSFGKWLSSPAAGNVLPLSVLAVAALLRFHDLDRTSIWYDEAVSWHQSKGSFGALLSTVAADNYPPLHNVILWLTMPVLGDSEFALRFPSACLGVLAVWLIHAVGCLLGGRITGLLAAALLAVSPFHIWYSTEARMYALLAACGLAFLLCVLKVLNRPSGVWLAGLAVSGAVFLYSHVYALFGFATVGSACAVLAISDILRTRSPRGSNALTACFAMAASVLAFLPWLFVLASRARSVAETEFWIAFPGGAFLNTLAFGLSGSLILFWVLVILAAVCVLFGPPASTRPSGKGATGRRAVAVCCAYTFGPAGLAYLYSTLFQPILFDRYLIAAWPGLLLLASAGAQKLVPKFGPAAVLAAALVLIFPEMKFTLFEKVRPEWREVAADYEAHRSPGDRLILYKGFAAPALAYYLREPAAFDAVDDLRQIAAAEESWLLVVHSNSQETAEAITAFGLEDRTIVSRRFGWGASGLKLLGPRTGN